MSGGKQAARDARWGRRGGGWVEGDAIDVALAAIDDARTRGLAAGTWPDGTPKGDRECRVCAKPIGIHGSPCEFCGRPPEHHAVGDLAAEIAGKARMAAARLGAGLPLDDIDRRAMAEAQP